LNQRIVKTFLQCVRILSTKDQRKLALVTAMQSFLGLLDLVGVALLGAIGALAVRGVQSQEPGDRVNWVIEQLGLGQFSLQTQVSILTTVAVTFLILKTVASILLSRKSLFFLAHRSAEISADLVSKTLSGEMEDISRKSTLEIQYAIGPGVNYIGLGIIGLGSTVIADFSLLLILGLGLLVIDAFTFVTVTVLFTFIGIALYKLLHTRARRVGSEMATFNIQSNQMLNESLLAFREIFVRNRQNYYAENISRLKLGFAKASAEQTFLPNVSKYIIEISVTLGAVLVAAIQFTTQDASRAVASLALFIAAGSRIAPALLRIQQSLIQMQSNIGGSAPTLNLISELKDRELQVSSNSGNQVTEFVGAINFKDVSFSYKSSQLEVLKNISLQIHPGEFIAIAGESGAGKSTLVDLLLGLLEPTSGKVEVSGYPPREAISQWPNAVSYVPQTVSVFEDTILKNVGIGFQNSDISEKRVTEVINLARLDKFVGNLPSGIHEILGERGNTLSGGQIQRLGIARALYNNPSLLILDEATSSLDSTTESEITEMITQLKGQLTLIVIAHRLSTIRQADRVIFLKDGEINASGSFSELRAKVSEFDDQAKLMGLQ
jgi:ABC-type multidrug transport system fused ATPase/permease subunit